MTNLGVAKNAAGQIEGFEIFIKRLSPETTKANLLEYFSALDNIVGEPRLMMDGNGKCKGVGWLTFSTETSFKQALGWDGSNFLGRSISVTPGKQIHTGIRPTLQAEGTHTPVLCDEVVRKLVAPNPGGVYVDGTFGRGGHSRAILAALSASGKLHAFDMDPEAILVGKKLMAEDSRFTIHHAPFSTMKAVLKPLGVKPSGVFMDLGISSPQFDTAGRGFRLEADGPLDLRFDQTTGETAYEFLMSASRDEICRVLSEYGETADSASARRIADAICLARSCGTLPKRTREFAAFVANAKGKEYQAMHPAKLTFQALRIHLNNEFGEIRMGLTNAFKLLREGGRIGILTWKHSECEVVVDVFRSLEAVRPKTPLMEWYSAQKGATTLPEGWSLEMDDVTRPTERELAVNSRSRSALLHVFRKCHLPRMMELERLVYEMPAWLKAVGPHGERNTEASEPPQLEIPAPKRQKTPKLSMSVDTAVLASKSEPVSVQRDVAGSCNHCASPRHVAKRCTFGVLAHERFLFCSFTRPYLPCFWRRFMVPLGSACADKFDPVDPRGSGRVDVAVRCITGALFRSQGLRHNSQICLSFEKSGHTLEVSGALVRGLVPDEHALAARVRGGLDSLLRENCGPPDAVEDPEGWCASPLRGFEPRKRTTLAALKKALRPVRPKIDSLLVDDESQPERICLLLLHQDGVPIVEACKQLRQGLAVKGVVAVIGDHRGLTEREIVDFAALGSAAGAEVLRVSLGDTILLGSHAIVILQHYLDEHLHRCEVPHQVDYSRGR